MIDFKGKIILVTGAGGEGIGYGTALALAKLGATVILNGRNEKKVKEKAETISNAVPMIADIRNKKQVDTMFKDIIDRFGTIDGLVNNAGVGNSKPAHTIDEDTFDFLYDIDVKSVWYLSKLFAQHHISNKTHGNIVNVSSVHSTATIDGYALYSSAKSAVEGLTKGMAVELGKHNIRVNAIAPGYVHSEQNIDLIATWTDDPHEWVNRHINDYQLLNFQITSEDCGNSIAYLLSDLSRAVTGQVIFTDNGLTHMLYDNKFIKKLEK